MNLAAFVKRGWGFWHFVALVSFAVVIALLVYPLAAVVQTSVAGRAEGGILAGGYLRFFTLRYYYTSLLNSLMVGALAAIGAVLLGVPLAYFVTRYDVPSKSAIRAGSLLSFLSPPFIGSYAWVLLLGRSGVVTEALREVGIELPTIYGWRGIVLVFVLQFYPFVFLLVSAALRSVDQSLEDAALSLGASETRTFVTVILPILLPSVSAGALLVFMAALADFGTPMIIGERFRVLPMLVYSEFVNELGGNPVMASTLAVVLVAVSTGTLLLQRHFAFKRAHGVACVRPLEPKRLAPLQRALVSAYAYGLVLLGLIPILSVVVSSFLKTRGPILLAEFSVESYRRILYLVPSAMRNTLFLSSAATALDILFGILVAYVLVRRGTRLSGVLDSLVMLPYAIPGTVLAVGLVIVYNRPPVVLAGTWLILVLSYFIRRLPYCVRACAAMLQQIDASVEEASINLGMPPMRTFLKVTVPLIGPAVVSGAVLSWVTIIGELSSTVILYSAPWATMPVHIFGQVFSGHFGPASALATILVIATFLPLMFLFRRTEAGAEFAV